MSGSRTASSLSRAARRSTRSSLRATHNPSLALRAGKLHSTAFKHQDVTASQPLPDPTRTRSHSTSTVAPAMACLPLSQILRTYLITTISSSPYLLDASSSVLERLLKTNNTFLKLDNNPVLRTVLWESFYKQFCAGETAEQIAATTAALRQQGYAGVILEYALEVLKDAEGSDEMADVAAWKEGMLKSVDMATRGDFLGLKWSGMGTAALKKLEQKQDPSPAMHDAMVAVCQAAAAKNIALLPSAEETATLEGYFQWTMMMQKLFNRSGKSIVYNTYQAYLRQTPSNLIKHMDEARVDDFTLGVKVVRGAYLASEKRDLIHSTIEDTHAAYDGITDALVHQRYNDVLASKKDMPAINVVLATHNAESVRKAREARQGQYNKGVALTPLSFAQLQGMADEVSCSLLAKGHDNEGLLVEQVFKCTTWGTMEQCLGYLLRRAAENKDAASRTADSRRAMQREIWRRIVASLRV